MEGMIKIAGIQMEPVMLDKSRNLDQCLAYLEAEAGNGANLIVFPEATLTGYILNDLEEAISISEKVPGPATERMIEACRSLNVYSVFGLIEEDNNKYYNTAVMVGPDGLTGKYRKLHLPHVGMDRFLNHGDLPPAVLDTKLGKTGLGICYDLNFPEHARILAISGAEIIVTITNWPQGVEFAPQYLVHARVIENRVYLAAINRVGEERGVKFIGRSKIVDPDNKILAQGKPYRKDILKAEITPGKARVKKVVIRAGDEETDCHNDRRPEFYEGITQPLPDRSRIR